MKPFGPTSLVLDLANTPLTRAMWPTLTTDECTIIFSAAANGGSNDLYFAQRSQVGQKFAAPGKLPVVNSSASDNDPSVSSDGSILWFSSNRISGEGYHLYMASRSSPGSDFGTPMLASVNSDNHTDADVTPSLTTNGLTLWFSSNRQTISLGGNDIWHSDLTTVDRIPANSNALSSSADDSHPVRSEDGFTAYLASSRNPSQGNIWMARRTAIADEFDTPTPAPGLGDANIGSVSWISPDNCRIYGTVTGSLAGGLPFNLFMAARSP